MGILLARDAIEAFALVRMLLLTAPLLLQADAAQPLRKDEARGGPLPVVR